MIQDVEYFRPVTLYLQGEFFGNVHRIECRQLKVRVSSYAQYGAAIELTWIPKGKRSPRSTVLTYKPWGLVLDGYGHLEPDALFKQPATSGNALGIESRYTSCDSRWTGDFDGQLSQYIQSYNYAPDCSTVLLQDFRNHNSHAAVYGSEVKNAHGHQ